MQVSSTEKVKNRKTAARIAAADCDPARSAVFEVRGVSKIYRMGEIEVHALRSINLDLFEGELAVLAILKIPRVIYSILLFVF